MEEAVRLERSQRMYKYQSLLWGQLLSRSAQAARAVFPASEQQEESLRSEACIKYKAEPLK